MVIYGLNDKSKRILFFVKRYYHNYLETITTSFILIKIVLLFVTKLIPEDVAKQHENRMTGKSPYGNNLGLNFKSSLKRKLLLLQLLPEMEY